MKEHFLHYLPLYNSYIHVFQKLPYLNINNMPHQAQQQLNFIYLLQMAKDAGLIDVHTYYVPIKPHNTVFGCADGLIVNKYIEGVVKVQHKYCYSYNLSRLVEMMHDYTGHTDIFNITVTNQYQYNNCLEFFKKYPQVMHVYLDMHTSIADEELFNKAMVNTHTFLVENDKFKTINQGYLKTPEEYGAGKDTQFMHKVKGLFNKEL